MEEFEWGEFEAGGLDAVCYDGFERGEEGAEEGEGEAERGEVDVAVAGEGDAEDDGEKGDVG